MKYRVLKRIALKLFILCIALSFYFASRPIKADPQSQQIVNGLFSNCHSVGSGLCNCFEYAPGSDGAKRIPPSFFNCNAMFMCWCSTFNMIGDDFGNCYYPGDPVPTGSPTVAPTEPGDDDILFCSNVETGEVYECRNLPRGDMRNRTRIDCADCRPPVTPPAQPSVVQNTAIAVDTIPSGIDTPTPGPTAAPSATAGGGGGCNPTICLGDGSCAGFDPVTGLGCVVQPCGIC